MNDCKPTPAIIVGQTVTALGTLRSLARAGIKSFTVTDPTEMVRLSRWYKPIPGYEELRPGGLTDWLPDLDIGRAVLIPCSDHTVWQASQLLAITKDRISMSIASTSALETLVDKGRFAKVLERLDIPRPRTWLLENGQLPDALPDNIFSNVFLKPIDSQSFIRHFGVKAQRVLSKHDASRELERINRAGFSVLLQEYVPGPATSHFFIDGFVDRHHEVKALFARQRLRMHPLDFGNSSCMVSVPIEQVQVAAQSLRHLLNDIEFRGIFSAEFKFDQRDGEFKIIEVNARPWWYIEFATRCGVNVCEMAYLDALGEDVAAVDTYRVGASLVYARTDYFACRDRVLNGEMSIVSCLFEWLRSWRPVFRWQDPWPAIVGSSRFVLRQLGRPIRWLLPR